MKELVEKVAELYAAFEKDAKAQIENGNKAAGTRARKASLEIEKSNVLLIGPTGTGKTLLALVRSCNRKAMSATPITMVTTSAPLVLKVLRVAILLITN